MKPHFFAFLALVLLSACTKQEVVPYEGIGTTPFKFAKSRFSFNMGAKFALSDTAYTYIHEFTCGVKYDNHLYVEEKYIDPNNPDYFHAESHDFTFDKTEFYMNGYLMNYIDPAIDSSDTFGIRCVEKNVNITTPMGTFVCNKFLRTYEDDDKDSLILYCDVNLEYPWIRMEKRNMDVYSNYILELIK